MQDFYEKSQSFHQYVDKYCLKHEIDKETAFCHSVIRNAYEYYKDAEKGKISVTKVDVGCGGAEMGGDCK